MNIQKNAELLSAQIRLTNAKADIEELKRDKLAGELVDAETVQEEWEKGVRKVKSKLEAIPEIAPMLYGLEIQEIRDILRKKITEAEDELAAEEW